MDIGSGTGYPAAALSNFTPHPFTLDGVEISSMEGFLQSLKFSNPDMQAYVCTLVGKQAKFRGKKKKWWKTQVLYWQGVEYKRDSQEYTDLISRAFDAMAKNERFKAAILHSPNATFTHSMGKRKKNLTVLTEQEFVSNLYRVRANYTR